ncbi:hypothetical protein B6D52_00195 [Candidatus Parcubacteria bacterium 4484_255]|nr:MAG: hypothetical protein B6D52_00195 [Candidatus Parcubacteria bacterium 4484_255]
MRVNFCKTSKNNFISPKILNVIFRTKKYYYKYKIDIVALFVVIYVLFIIRKGGFSYKIFINLFIILTICKIVRIFLKYKTIKKQLRYISQAFDLQIPFSEREINSFAETLKKNPAMWRQIQKELLLIEKEINFLTFYGPVKARAVEASLVDDKLKNRSDL